MFSMEIHLELIRYNICWNSFVTIYMETHLTQDNLIWYNIYWISFDTIYIKLIDILERPLKFIFILYIMTYWMQHNTRKTPKNFLFRNYFYIINYILLNAAKMAFETRNAIDSIISLSLYEIIWDQSLMKYYINWFLEFLETIFLEFL